MKKHAIGAILISILWSTLAFITLAAGQPSRHIPTSPSHLPQQTTSPDIVTAAQFDLVTINASSSITWNEPCANHRMDITGTGMGDTDTPINPQTITLTDPNSVDWLLAQVAGRRLPGLPQLPDSVSFSTSAAEMVTLPTATSVTEQAYVFETELQSAAQITALVNQPGNDLTLPTPRGLILYARRATTERWTSVGKTTNQFVYWDVNPSQAETLDFPPLTQTTDLHFTAVVIDNDIKDDVRPLVLEAEAGGKIVNITVPGPTDGLLLNIVSLTLSQVPAGTDQAIVTLSSPKELDGDSLVLVGVNVSYRCGPVEGTDLGVTKTANRATAREGDIIAYTITVANHGPTNATGVQLSDVLPIGVTFSRAITSQGTYSSDSGLWIVNDVAKNASATLIITATVDSNTVGTTIVNTASHLIADQFDLIPGNNESSVAINVISDTVIGIYLPIIYKNYEPLICIPYFDDFSNSASGWQNLDNQYARLGYSAGQYFIFNKVSELRIVQAPTNFANKYTVEVKARWDSANMGYEYGLIFGQASFPIPTYRFAIDPVNQRYRLRYNNGSSWQCVNGPAPCWSHSSFINPNSSPNQLKVECSGATGIISLSVNSQLLWQGTGPSSCSGQVGVETQAFPAPALAYFDNFQVSCPSAEINSLNSQSSNSTSSSMSTGLDIDE